jgi:hypothetical protein
MAIEKTLIYTKNKFIGLGFLIFISLINIIIFLTNGFLFFYMHCLVAYVREKKLFYIFYLYLILLIIIFPN